MKATVHGTMKEIGGKQRAICRVVWNDAQGRETSQTVFGEGDTEDAAKQALMLKAPGLKGVMIEAIAQFTAGTPEAHVANEGATIRSSGPTVQEKVRNLLGLITKKEHEDGAAYRKRLFDLITSLELEVVKKGTTEELVALMTKAIEEKHGPANIEIQPDPLLDGGTTPASTPPPAF